MCPPVRRDDRHQVYKAASVDGLHVSGIGGRALHVGLNGAAAASHTRQRDHTTRHAPPTFGTAAAAPSRSSLRSYTSHSSYSTQQHAGIGGGGGSGGASSNPFWQPSMLPALCGELDPVHMPLQLRVMPQGGPGGTSTLGTRRTRQHGEGDRYGAVQPWSRAVRLSHSGAMETLALPCPLPKEDAASGGVRDMQAGAYFVAVRLVRVRGRGRGHSGGGGGGGSKSRCTWALHVLPRFVLHNALPLPLQLQQPGAGRVRTLLSAEDRWVPLGPGLRRPVHWPDAAAPLRLSLRISEPGWSWSGSVDVGSGVPGDLFVKVGKKQDVKQLPGNGLDSRAEWMWAAVCPEHSSSR